MTIASMNASRSRKPGGLGAEREVELAQVIEAGLYARHLLDTGSDRYSPSDLHRVAAAGRCAFDEFVEANMPLVMWWAKRRINSGGSGGLSLDDVVSEGVVGLIRAIMKFDYMRGIKFSTYASNWIRSFQARAAGREAGRGLPQAERELIGQVLTARSDLVARLGRTPICSEVAAELGVPPAVVDRVELLMRWSVSLDALLIDDGRDSFVDLLSDERAGHAFAEVLAALDVDRLLAQLNGRERAVIVALFGLADQRECRSVAAVARSMHVPTELVAKTASSALTHLREAAGVEGVLTWAA